MSDELIDSYVDRAAVADDTKYFLDSIGQIIAAYDKLNSIKVTLAGAGSMSDIVNGANEARAAVDKLTTTTDKLLKSDILAAKAAKEQANAQLAKAKAAQATAKTAAERAKADQAEAKALKELAAAEKTEAQAQKELAAANKLTAQARKENAAAALKEKQLANAEAREKEKQQLNDIGAAYREYSKAAREASLRAKSYALTLGEADPRTQAAVKNAKEMNETLARVDASVGQFGRNVGNYKSGFDGLANSFTQISRELPSLSISFQTFALAVSNNLPEVFDQIKNVSEEVRELRSQGEQTPGVFKRMLTSALSLNVGISIAIALFTAYAGAIGDAIMGLFDASIAANKAAKEQQEYNKRLEESIELNERFAKDTKLFDSDTPRDLENQLAFARARGASEKEILQIERAILEQRQKLASAAFFDSKGKAQLDALEETLKGTKTEMEDLLKKTGISYTQFSQMFGLTGVGVGEIKGLTDEEKERLEFLKTNFDIQEKGYLRQKAIVTEFYNANRDLTVKDLEIAALAAGQRLSFFAEPLEREKALLESLSEFEELSVNRRIAFSEEAAAAQKKIIEGQYSDAVFNAKGNDIKLKELARKRAFDLQVIDEDLEKRRIEIRAQALAKQRDLEREEAQKGLEEAQQADEDRANAQVAAAQSIVDKRQRESARGQQIEISALNKSYTAAIAATKEGSREREKVERDFAIKRAEIEQSYVIAELKNQIDFAEQYIKIRKAAGDDVTNNEAELSKLRMQLSDLETQHIIDNKAKEAAKQKDLFEDIQRGLDDFKTAQANINEFVGGILNASIEKQQQQIEQQLDDIEKRKNAEIDAINATSLTDLEKKEAIATAEKRAALQREQLERRQAALEQQRARFEKAVTVGRIISDTAAAVVAALGAKPWTPANFAAAAAVGAVGTGRLAVALATPIPKFKDGRDGGAATYAIVGDGGQHEVVTSPDLKQAYVTPKTDTLTYLQKDWKVFPNMDAFKAAAAGMAGAPSIAGLPSVSNDNGAVVAALQREFGTLREVVRNKQENHIYWKNGELMKATKRANDWTRYIQSNF